MAVTHVNRKGQTYHLLLGRTKTGKPKYYVSKKPGENAAEAIPEGFELYEHPADGIVHFRRVRPTRLTSMERAIVVAEVERATGGHFFVEIEGDALVVYWLHSEGERLNSMLAESFGSRAVAKMAARNVTHGRYEPLLRFVLVDESERTFAAERMCFRGGMDRWIRLSEAAELAELVRRFATHLGRESFFDLI